MKKIIRTLRKIDAKWLNHVTGNEFDIVAQDDFNPDGVLIFGYEMYQRGVRHGIGFALMAIGAGLISSGVGMMIRDISEGRS